MVRLVRPHALIVAALTLTACSGNPLPEQEAAAAPPVTITVTPADGADRVKHDTPIRVRTGNGGTLERVDATDAEGAQLDGDFNDERSEWVSTDRMGFDTSYQVLASARAAGGDRVTESIDFRTRDVPESDRFYANRVAPLDGSTVGVAQPLVVGFSRPVTNREEIEQALKVTTRPSVEGAWYWVDAQSVHYRPETFWPAGTEVTLDADLRAVPGGHGMWGGADRTVSFTVGRKQVIRVDVDDKRLKVVRGGETLRSFPVSTGKPGWETRDGVKVIMEKVYGKTWTNEAIDAPEEYTLYSDYAMRMTNSGEFIHDAPWNVGNIGSANTSHGCVGLTPSDMTWLMKKSMVGDPVIVTGSPREYTEIWNRYQDWNVDWSQWRGGNRDLSDD